MKKFLAVFFAMALIPSLAIAQNSAPDPAAGKALWEGANSECRNCHGKEGQGAFGPSLAGRGLTPSQIQAAVHEPTGIMLAFTKAQLGDADINNLAAYLASLPKKNAPGPWLYNPTADMPPGQQVLLSVGCGQCHGPAFRGPRGTLGGVNADFALFKRLVYNHTATYPVVYEKLRAGNPPAPPPPDGIEHKMGNYSPRQVSESQLRKIYDWARNGIGFRAAITGRLSAPAMGGATYALNIRNDGLKGKGLAIEGVTVDLALPAGITVVNATGDDYKGIHRDAQAKADVAEWQIPRLSPKDAKEFGITLSKPDSDNLKGVIHWAKTAPAHADSDVSDVENIVPAPSVSILQTH